MNDSIKSIYEIFNDYTYEEVDDVISKLSLEDKKIIYDRYGGNLYYPSVGDNWNDEKAKRFYGSIVPKIKRMLQKLRKNTFDNKLFIPSFESIDDIDKLLELIKLGYSNKNICDYFGIDNKKLQSMLSELKKMGMGNISRKYYDDGHIGYKYASDDLYGDKELITNNDYLRMLVISDLHIGNQLERPDLLYRAFDYCTREGIHIIMCCGDILDGTFTAGEQNITDVYRQINRFLKIYPFSDDILTFGVGGDHDESILNSFGLDIVSACYHYRSDIVIGGYRDTIVKVANDKIHLFHKSRNKKMKGSIPSVVLRGHSHLFKTAIYNKSLNISVPTLSDITKTIPSALELRLSLNNSSMFDKAVIKQLYFGSKDMILGVQTFEIPEKNSSKTNVSSNDDKVYVKKPMSQIDKFNKRYGNYMEGYR